MSRECSVCGRLRSEEDKDAYEYIHHGSLFNEVLWVCGDCAREGEGQDEQGEISSVLQP